MRRTALAGLLLVALAAACDDPTTPSGVPELAGAWSGVSGPDTGLPRTLVLQLETDGEDVMGTAQLQAGGESVGLEVEGSYEYPDVALTLRAEGYAPLQVTGQYRRFTAVVGEPVRPDSIAASLNGSGFNGAPIVLRRPEGARPAALPARRR